MIIDCDRCAMRGIGCSDCVISVLLDAPPTVEFEEPELRALGNLADAGLVPHLRLVPIRSGAESGPGSGAESDADDSDVAGATPENPVASPASAERSHPLAGRQRRQVS